ncbi:MAG TPA: hypothetical protein VFP35_01240 [Candidatus Saccharimonadales bacterium]|nr:hypothetical protein [Candidatus Saccharimonadales bacterium]
MANHYFKKQKESGWPQKITSLSMITILLIAVVLFGPGTLFAPKADASALSFVCASSAASTSTAACSGEQAGDLLLVSASITGSSTVPTTASGFTSINTASTSSGPGSNRNAITAGWSTAASASSTSGTWTGATNVVMQVFRGQAASPVGSSITSTGSATSVTYAADSLTATDGSSWFAGVAVRNTADTRMATAPTGMVSRATSPATPVAAANDTNGPTGTNWPSTNVTGFSASANYASIVIEILASPAITAGTFGTHVASLTIGTTGNYVGGAFTFVRDVGSANITSIKVHNSGTVNAQTNLANLTLYYKQEATCEATFPTSGTTQFNSTPGSFNASGDATVTGSLSVSTSQYCFYAKIDVGSGAISGSTLKFQITDPATDVLASVGSVTPATVVAISGSATIVPPGPTTDQVMRGGEWFTGGVKQSYFWAQ